MVYFQTKIPNWDKFWKVLQWKILVFLEPFCLHILRTNVMYNVNYGHLVHFVVIWYIFSRFGMLYRVKSGNPVPPKIIETYMLKEKLLKI
jgi:hypothetical protein